MENTPDGLGPSGISNEARYYYWLYKVAKTKYDSNLPGDRAKAFEDCERLRLIPELPLMVLVRVHILLSTQDEDDGPQSAYALEHANTAIRILDEEVRPIVRSNEKFPQAAYNEAVRIRDLLLQEAAEATAVEAARDDLPTPMVVSGRVDPPDDDADDDNNNNSQHLTVPGTLAASLDKDFGQGKTGLGIPVASHTPTGQTETIAPPSAIQKPSLMAPDSPERKRKKQLVQEGEDDGEKSDDDDDE